MPKPRNPILLAHLLLLAVVLIWGTTFPLVKSALADATPLAFNLLRMIVAFAALAAINHRQLRNLPRAHLKTAALAGIFLALGYQFQTAGLARTSASKSAFITGLVVVLVLLLSAIPAFRPRNTPTPRWPAYAGAATAFAGLLFLTLPAHSTGPATTQAPHEALGELLTLLCALAFAAHLLTLGHAARSIPARTLGTIQIGVAAALMLLTLPLGGSPHVHFTPRLVFALAVTGLLATAAAFTIQSWAQQHISSTHTALIFTLEPVFAWLTSLLFLHERLTPRELLGAALILTGILAAELLTAPTPLDASNS